MDSVLFKHPTKRYRPCAFWAWNDMLDIEELKWQVREFAEKGFGGYFMHSRIGLATPYLSEEWMNCVRACLKEGKKIGIDSWLYDEDRYPSGFAGGLVSAKGDEYRGRYVFVREVNFEEALKALKETSVLGVFEIHFSSVMYMEVFRRINKPDEIKGDGRLFVFKITLAPYGGLYTGNDWIEISSPPYVVKHSRLFSSFRYNDGSYVDLLNPKVTEEFLKVTLDVYAKQFKEDFGEGIPGIFTDEPNYLGRNTIPWTEEMIEVFRKNNGYDILEKLPLLYFEGEGFHKVRYDFWKTVALRFIEAWTIPYAKRCEKYGLMMTGHYLYEDSLDFQVRHIGAAMPHYEYMHIPGVDHLGRSIENHLTLKQCSSIAHQLDKKRVLSELFGCSGYEVSFEDLKWIADFHFVFGINFLCLHLTYYTMKGEAKRDYPPTFSYHQPYWEHFKILNDYFARACYICSQGKTLVDILVLHPIGSVWATFTHLSPIIEEQNSEAWKFNESLVKLQDDLLALHRDFDYGDETVLHRHACIIGKEFVVNKGRYKIVVVPPSLTWSVNTYNLLMRFLDAGGTVLFINDLPTLIDGEPAVEKWRKILSYSNAILVSHERQALEEAINKKLPRSISIVDENGNENEDVFVCHRVEGTRHIYFVFNKSRTNKHDVIIKFAEKGEVTKWNLLDGSINIVDAVNLHGYTIITEELFPAESHVFVLDTSKPLLPRLEKATPQEEVIQLPNKWDFDRLHLNSMVLDTCQFSFGDSKWSEKKPIWKARVEARKRAGLEKYAICQPWVLKTKNIYPAPFKVNIRVTFKSEIKDKQVYLIIEKASAWQLKVNHKFVSTHVKEWYWDKQFGMIDISDHVKVGYNLIDLSCKYSLDVPIENIYLVGNFGVKKISNTEYVITEEPKTLSSGNWIDQGYPFYTGTIRYKTVFSLKKKSNESRVLIRLPEAKGSLFIININGKGNIPICWQPFEADVTEFVKDGQNEITIDVVSSLRNSFGPLHNKIIELHSVTPATFVDENNWTDSYQLVPYGLIKGAQIIVQK